MKNNGIKTYIAIAGIILTVLLLIVGLVKGYTKLEGKVDTVEVKVKAVEDKTKNIPTNVIRIDTVEGEVKRIKETDLPNIEGDLDYHDDRLYEQEKEVFGLKKEIGYLGEKVDRNYEVQEKILSEIKELSK